jgi:hypothetical protein
MWKANGKTTTLQLFLDSLSPKLDLVWKRLWTCRETHKYLDRLGRKFTAATNTHATTTKYWTTPFNAALWHIMEGRRLFIPRIFVY